jgi:hypothetical protein
MQQTIFEDEEYDADLSGIVIQGKHNLEVLENQNNIFKNMQNN